MPTLIDGTAGNDLLTGTSGNDFIRGYAGNDRLVGLAGDDTLDGGAGTNQIDAGDGNDTILIDGSASNGVMRTPATGIDGGAGVDTIQFAGAISSFHIVQIAGGWLQVDDLVNGGRTLAVNVEHLQFTDTDLWLVPQDSAPVVSGDLAISVTEGAGLVTIDALANAHDPEGAALAVTGLSALPEGVSFDPLSHSFTVDGNAGAFDALAAGEQLTLRIDYGVTDGTSVTATSGLITVTGTNDAAQVAGVLAGAVSEDSVLTASGQASVSDADHGQSAFVAETMAGLYGNLTIDADGLWSYALNNRGLAVQSLAQGQIVQDLLTVQSVDGTTSTITIAVSGAADRLIVGTEASDRLTGTKAAEQIFGLGGFDRINGGGGNDTLTGGAGGDTFVFSGHFGHDTITDFDPSAAREVINLSRVTGAHDFADLVAHHMTETGGSTLLAFGDQTITLEGVSMSSLTAADFLF
ncbi:putative secreted protein (type I secretion substrate) [Rhodobacter viridis]|uniref:Putative secreted protein (Type I secretion substrate) n=1 Tax=Rhodobacter viridis TaxID=1054202 RepID=A0A318TSD4_9RHOB|nr:VCBS domain-containing protein [Rhodobacter viridis]PYF07761.1 putative secreted protein (type I secretion substrate) [Rhodobacter viridis]